MNKRDLLTVLCAQALAVAHQHLERALATAQQEVLASAPQRTVATRLEEALVQRQRERDREREYVCVGGGMREREKERATRRSFPRNNATLQRVLKRHWRIDREGESGNVCEGKRKERER